MPQCFIQETCTGDEKINRLCNYCNDYESQVFSNILCQILGSPFALYFPGYAYSSENYVKIDDQESQELSAFTICYWNKFLTDLPVTVLSYTAPGLTSEIIIGHYWSNVGFTVKNHLIW